MEKTSYTPGPWEIGSYLEDPFGNDYVVKTIYQVTPQRTRYICDLLGGANPKIKKEVEANARLIAASPDLLATLEKVANCSRYPMNEPENMAHALNTLRELARSAIAKAEGRE